MKLAKHNALSAEDMEQYELWGNAVTAYSIGRPIMTDPEFDALELSLIAKGILVDKQERVNSTKTEGKVQALAYMGSLAALHSHTHPDLDAAVTAHIGNSMSDIDAMFKFDGLAIEVAYANGYLKHVITRGGEDVTAKFAYRFPEKLCKPVYMSLHIEAVLPVLFLKEELQHLNYANPRNAAAGIVARHDKDYDKYIALIIHTIKLEQLDKTCSEMLMTELSYVDSLLLIEELDMTISTAWSSHYHKVLFASRMSFKTVIEAMNQIADIRDTLPFWIDGLVFRNKHTVTTSHANGDSLNAIAVKFEPPAATTTVLSIDYQQGKTGKLTPVANLVPVEIDGTIVKRVTLSSYQNMLNLDVYPGCVVQISKRGDIIPYIEQVISRPAPAKSMSDLLPPVEYEQIGANLFIKDRTELNAHRFVAGCRTLGIKGLGPKFCWQLFHDAKWDSIIDLYELAWSSAGWLPFSTKVKELTKVDRGTEKTLPSLYERLTRIAVQHFIHTLALDDVGTKTAYVLESLVGELPIDTKGVTKEIITDFMSDDDTLCFLRNAVANGYLYYVNNTDDIVSSTNRTTDASETQVINVCLTGSPKSAGYATKEAFLSHIRTTCPHIVLQEVDVHKGCRFLISNDFESSSKKTQYAKSNNVNMLLYSDAYDMFKTLSDTAS